MKTLSVNLNVQVRVKPTQLGMAIIQAEHDGYTQPFRDKGVPIPDYFQEPIERLDAEGYITMSLWRCMQLFGSHMGIGMSNAIEATILMDAHDPALVSVV